MRFGIIGCGVISTTHGNAIKAAPGAELVAVADILPEAAKKFAAEFGASAIHTDYHELLARKDIEAVCICTPSGMHGDMVVAAAKAGKHVICEKPLDVNRAQMEKMIRACRDAKVKLSGIFQRRMGANAARVKAAVAEGHFGKMVQASATLKYYRSQEYYDSATWRATWDLDGGGCLMNQGVHGIDLIQWLMGGVKRVHAVCATRARNIQVEDTAVILMEFMNGALGVVEAGTAVYPAQETKVELHGEKGTVILTEAAITRWQRVGENDRSAEFEAELKAGGSGDPRAIGFSGHQQIVTDLMEAVRDNREVAIPGEEARKAVDLILAIYESSKTGKWIDV